jgi:hypothetical protein
MYSALMVEMLSQHIAPERIAEAERNRLIDTLVQRENSPDEPVAPSLLSRAACVFAALWHRAVRPRRALLSSAQLASTGAPAGVAGAPVRTPCRSLDLSLSAALLPSLARRAAEPTLSLEIQHANA